MAKLFTKAIDKKLFAQFPLGSDLSAQKIVAKIFNPYGKGTWFLINSDPNDPDYLYGIVVLDEVEVGSFLRSDLENLKFSGYNLPLERELYEDFDDVTAEEMYQKLRKKHGSQFDFNNDNDPPVIDVVDFDDDDEVDVIEDSTKIVDLNNLPASLREANAQTTKAKGWGDPIETSKIRKIVIETRKAIEAGVPENIANRFAIGTFVEVEGEVQDTYVGGLEQYQEDYIEKMVRKLIYLHQEDEYQSGFKYMDITDEDIFELGFRLFEEERTIPYIGFDGKPKDAKYKIFITEDFEHVLSFNIGASYSGLFSQSFIGGYEMALAILKKATYVKDVDFFGNGLGGVSDIEENKTILIEAISKKLDSLNEEIDYLKSELDNEDNSLQFGGDIDKVNAHTRALTDKILANNHNHNSKVIIVDSKNSFLEKGGNISKGKNNIILAEIWQYPQGYVEQESFEVGSDWKLSSGQIQDWNAIKEEESAYNPRLVKIITDPAYVLEYTKKSNDIRIKRNSSNKLSQTYKDLVNEIAERDSMVIRDKDGNSIGVKEVISSNKKYEKGGKTKNHNLTTIAEGEYLTLATQGNKLHIFLTDEGREWVGENGNITEDNFSELFEDIQGNSELNYFQNAGNVGLGLTEAPVITDGYFYGDDGDLEANDDARLWYYNLYATKDPMEELSVEGEVDFDSADNFKKGGATKSKKKQYNPTDFKINEPVLVNISKEGKGVDSFWVDGTVKRINSNSVVVERSSPNPNHKIDSTFPVQNLHTGYIVTIPDSEIYAKGGQIGNSGNTSKVAQAEILGTKAFRDGKKRIFALDKDANELLAGHEVGNPLNQKIMDAWYKNWDMANLNTDPTPSNTKTLFNKRYIPKSLEGYKFPSVEHYYTAGQIGIFDTEAGMFTNLNSDKEMIPYSLDWNVAQEVADMQNSGEIKEEDIYLVPHVKSNNFNYNPNEHKYYVVSITNDGYWVVTSKETTKELAEQLKELTTPVSGEYLAVKTVEEVKKHPKTLFERGGITQQTSTHKPKPKNPEKKSRMTFMNICKAKRLPNEAWYDCQQRVRREINDKKENSKKN